MRTHYTVKEIRSLGILVLGYTDDEKLLINDPILKPYRKKLETEIK